MRLLFVAVALLVGASCLKAQVPYEKESVFARPQLTWTTIPWQGDERPYRTVRRKVDKAVQASKDLYKTVEQYRRLAQQDLLNPRPQFAWAYAAYRSSVEGAKMDAEMAAALRQLNTFKAPYTYEYARLLFILEARSRSRSQLIFAGRKLVERNPKDYSVLFYLVKIMDPGRSAGERAEAIAYSERLVQLQPKRANAWSALGYTYLKSWFKTKNRTDRDSSLAAYNKFLKLAPARDPFRPQAMRIIAMLKGNIKS